MHLTPIKTLTLISTLAIALFSCESNDPEVDAFLDQYEAVLIRAENAYNAGEHSQLPPLINELLNYALELQEIIEAGTASTSQNTRLEALYNRFLVLLQ
jgi:hypothetical protein